MLERPAGDLLGRPRMNGGPPAMTRHSASDRDRECVAHATHFTFQHYAAAGDAVIVSQTGQLVELSPGCSRSGTRCSSAPPRPCCHAGPDRPLPVAVRPQRKAVASPSSGSSGRRARCRRVCPLDGSAAAGRVASRLRSAMRWAVSTPPVHEPADRVAHREMSAHGPPRQCSIRL
jgi:hypothetical protein